MAKKYKVIPTKKQLKAIKKYWKALQVITREYMGEVTKLEILMEKETNIKGIEFFFEGDGYCAVECFGVMEKIYDTELNGN